jgi:hypothetical protein
MFSSLAFAIMPFKQFSGFAVCSPSKVRCRHGEVVPATVTDAEGARHSIDVRAESTFDAAHLYVATARSQQAAMLPSRIPVPTVAIVFEVVAEGKIFRVHRAALRRWIAKRREELGGPKGQLVRERPGID